MHIVYIHQYFTTPGIGGGTRSYEFAKRLVKHGHTVTVLTGRPIPEEAMGEIPDGVQVLSSGTLYNNSLDRAERIRSFIEFAIKAIQMGWRVRPDVIVATSTPLTVGVPAMVLAMRHRVPYVFEVRDLWPEAPIQMGAIRNPIIIWSLRVLEKLIYKRSARIIALSPGMKRGVIKVGIPSEKVSMIPNSSDVSLFEPGPIDTSFLSERGLPLRPSIAYAGALGEANAMDLLAEAAIRLHELGVEVQLLIAGDGKYRPFLERVVKEHDLKTLVLLGRLPKYDVIRLFKASVAGLVLFSDVPILQTNSPNKFFDLLAAGRPIITNMKGWIADLVREHQIGYIVDGRDVDGLVQAITRAATQLEFPKMAGNARRLAEERFDRNLLAQQFEEVVLQAVTR